MLKVWIERIPGLPVTPLLYPNLGEEGGGRQLFQRAFRDFHTPLVEIVHKPEEADAFLLAHNYPLVAGRRDTLARYTEYSQRLGKRIIVFWHGDGTGPVPLPNAKVFRTSQYRSRLREQDVIMPAYAEDLSQSIPLDPRTKSNQSPVVGFCGWAEYRDFQNAVGTALRSFPWELLSFVTRNPAWRARIKGLKLRREAINCLQGSALVQARIVLRSSHSAHAATIRVDPAEARRTYIDTMQHSDLAFCLKGDGNYSLRFYEALSLGRVPLLLDTDSAFPLEDRIDYSSFMVRVPLNGISALDRAAAEFWAGVTPEEFLLMQRLAREAFEQWLSAPAFLRYAVRHLFSPSQSLIPNP